MSKRKKKRESTDRSIGIRPEVIVEMLGGERRVVPTIDQVVKKLERDGIPIVRATAMSRQCCDDGVRDGVVVFAPPRHMFERDVADAGMRLICIGALNAHTFELGIAMLDAEDVKRFVNQVGEVIAEAERMAVPS